MTEKCQWQEAVLPDGRRYYFNPSTGESTWDKPSTYIPHGGNAPVSNIMSASAIIKQHMTNTLGTMAVTGNNTDVAASWREMTNASGKKYYYNTLTKVSVWEMPAEYREYLSRQRDPALVSKEKGESLFHKMLKEHEITSKWSWEETLREVINDPKYKCLPTLAERKASFATFIEKQKQIEIEENEQKKKNSHENFLKMLSMGEENRLIDGDTRFIDGKEIFNRDKRWHQFEDEREKQFVFEEFIGKLKKSRALELQEKRKIASWKFIQLLRKEPDLNDLGVQWKEALIIFGSMKEFKEDSDIQILQPIDLLIIFEDHIKRLEYLEDRKRQKIQIQREMNRVDAQISFELLLDRLIKDGSFTAMTCWSEIFTIIREEKAFLDMLPTVPGTSGPLDLYWDKLDKLQQTYLPHRQIIYSKLESIFGERDGWSTKDLEQMTSIGKLDELLLSNTDNIKSDIADATIPDSFIPSNSIDHDNLIGEGDKKSEIENESIENGENKKTEKHEKIIKSLGFKSLILRELHKIHTEILKRQTQKNLEDIDINSLKQQYRFSIDKYKKALKNLGHINLSSSFLDYKSKLDLENFNDDNGNPIPEILKIVYFEKYIAHLKRKFGSIDNDNNDNDDAIQIGKEGFGTTIGVDSADVDEREDPEREEGEVVNITPTLNRLSVPPPPPPSSYSYHLDDRWKRKRY